MPKNEPKNKTDNETGENIKKAAAASGEPPQLDFTSFILSLSTSVLMNLGVIENPMTKMKEREPLVARQTIDLITLLKEKTKGNLTEEEARLVDDVLHELHLWYVKEAQ